MCCCTHPRAFLWGFLGSTPAGNNDLTCWNRVAQPRAPLAESEGSLVPGQTVILCPIRGSSSAQSDSYLVPFQRVILCPFRGLSCVQSEDYLAPNLVLQRAGLLKNSPAGTTSCRAAQSRALCGGECGPTSCRCCRVADTSSTQCTAPRLRMKCKATNERPA